MLQDIPSNVNGQAENLSSHAPSDGGADQQTGEPPAKRPRSEKAAKQLRRNLRGWLACVQRLRDQSTGPQLGAERGLKAWHLRVLVKAVTYAVPKSLAWHHIQRMPEFTA